MTIIPLVLNLGAGFVETWSRPIVVLLALLPALVAIGVYYILKGSKWSNLRSLALAPLGFGVILGINSCIDVNRSGVGEYLDVGVKTMMLFYAIIIVPILAMLFLVFREFKDKKMAARQRAR